MDVLRRHRHFDHMHLIGLAWHDSRGCDALIQRLLAQSVVELGALDRADELLDEAAKAGAASPKDLDFTVQAADYQGLRGRIRKQRFVLTGDVNLVIVKRRQFLSALLHHCPLTRRCRSYEAPPPAARGSCRV